MPTPIRGNSDSLSSRIGNPPGQPSLLPPEIDPGRDQRAEAFPHQQTLKKAAAVIRSKSKTERLVELCDQVAGSDRKTDDWLARCERFFHSPVWKLVSDEAILKARSRCECWGCKGRAMQVQLLEFPAEHLEPGFNWMNRNDILMALCSHHYEIAHRAVMTRVLPLDRQSDTGVFAEHAGRPGKQERESAC